MALKFEQQQNESAKAFAAFALYLSMGPERSTAAVGKALGKSEGLMERWASRWRWTERVASRSTVAKCEPCAATRSTHRQRADQRRINCSLFANFVATAAVDRSGPMLR